MYFTYSWLAYCVMSVFWLFPAASCQNCGSAFSVLFQSNWNIPWNVDTFVTDSFDELKTSQFVSGRSSAILFQVPFHTLRCIYIINILLMVPNRLGWHLTLQIAARHFHTLLADDVPKAWLLLRFCQSKTVMLDFGIHDSFAS